MTEVRDVGPADLARALELGPAVESATVVERGSSAGSYPTGRTEIEIEVDAAAVPVEVADALYSRGWRIVTVRRSGGSIYQRIRAARCEEVRGL